ncbi:MAG: hypothetical protein GX585_05980 [Clostridiales bacterium]|nr:hypothetical protein [Clostridiales bacterium]
MKVTNTMNLPQAFVEACKRDDHPRFGMDTFSATELLKGTKEILLVRRHWDTLEQDAADMVWLVLGKAVHKVFEDHEGEYDIAEGRGEAEIDVDGETIKVSGAWDLYESKLRILNDYKTTGVFSYLMHANGSNNDWRDQARVYWYILEAMGFPVDFARITVILKDWSKTKAKVDRSYPQKPVQVINYRFTLPDDLIDVKKTLSDKLREIRKYQDLSDDDIPPCSKEERWERDEKWAVMKKGRKTAVKLCNSNTEAEFVMESLGEGHYIEHREGTPVKCLDYCTVCDHCSFYKAYMANQSKESEA